MLIRCEKCSTTYELEERLIPPGGAPVQCSRCEHVFRAYPQPRRAEASPEADRRPGLELVPPPPDDLPDDAAAPVAQAELPGIGEPVGAEPDIADPGVGDAAPEPDVQAGAPGSAEQEWPPRPLEPTEPTEPEESPPYAAITKTPAPARVSGAGPAVPSEAGSGAGASTGASARPAPGSTYKPPPGPVIPPGKPVRKVPNPELEGSEATSVAPMPRRAVSFDVKPKKRGKSSWIVNGAVGLLVLLIIAGTISWWQERSAEKAARAAPTAAPAPSRALTRERQEAMKLLMRDDAASVERAAAQLDDIVRREQASGARADRALALALLSEQAREQAARLVARAAALEEERGRAVAGTGTPDQAIEPGAEPETLRAEVEPLQERARRLLSEARAELDALPASLRGDVAAVRARAWIELVSGSRSEAAQTAGAPGASEDPWIALASIVAGLPEGASGDAHERGAGQLEQLAAKHPGFVRPLLLAGRIRAGLGDGERALADFDGALRVNPQHLEARRVRADLAPAIPEASGAADEAGGPVEGAPPGASPAENGRSQGGNAPAAPPGR